MECNRFYPVENGVPALFADTKGASTTSQLHTAFGSIFHYIDHYRRDALEYDYFQEQQGATRHSEQRLREYISRKIPKTKGVMLDVGCGSAWVAKLFCSKGYPVVSFDISEKNTQEALKRYPSENHAAVAGDVFSPPFRKESFDYIIASEIIEHITEPDTFVKKLFELLKPGGLLVVTTPYKEKIEYSLCIHCNRPTPHSAHLHSFDEKILTALYNGNDLKNVTYTTFSNKALVYLHTHVILKWMGFTLWRWMDWLANLICPRPLRILVIWQKQESIQEEGKRKN
jgi:SAM-dependent methyltransferase